jgi:hypothetical protein
MLFDSVVDSGIRGMVSRQVYGGSTSKGLSDISPVSMKDPRVNQGKKLYIDALVWEWAISNIRVSMQG